MSLTLTNLVGFGAKRAAGGGTDTWIDPASHTIIGDMTGSAGLAAIFNGTTNSTSGACGWKSAANGYAGLQFAAGKPIGKVELWGSNDQGYVYTVNPSTPITLYGKNGAPSSGTDGTSLGSTTFTDSANESTMRTITSSDAVTTYTHVWCYIRGGGINTTIFAELKFYERTA